MHKYCMGPEEALNVQSGPQWETNSQKSLSWLWWRREKKNTSSWFMSSSKLGLRSQFYIPHQAAKGTQSSGWPEKQHPPGSLLSRAQAVWSSHSGIVRQRGWKQEKQNICAPTLPLFVT